MRQNTYTMKSYVLFQQYIWLINTIASAGRISFNELNQRWMNTYMSDNIPLSRSTFNRHREDITDIFGITIKCDKSNGFKYFISNEEVLEKDSIQTWMFSTLSVNSFLNDSKSVADRIILERIPSGGDNLRMFIEAMKLNVRISVKYRRYEAEVVKERIVDPYCIKLFNRRWYALVKSLSHDNPYILAFDRIQEISLTEEKFFIDKGFDALSWFKDSYGILRDTSVEIQTIRIRAYGREVFYVRDLPLHLSQKEIETTDEWSDFEINIRPTNDFFSPLLSRGALIKVLEPRWLADEIKSQHEAAAKLYYEQ